MFEYKLFGCIWFAVRLSHQSTNQKISNFAKKVGRRQIIRWKHVTHNGYKNKMTLVDNTSVEREKNALGKWGLTKRFLFFFARGWKKRLTVVLLQHCEHEIFLKRQVFSQDHMHQLAQTLKGCHHHLFYHIKKSLKFDIGTTEYYLLLYQLLKWPHKVKSILEYAA